MDTQLDPQLVNYLKATRDVESQGNFQAKGASGEYGAYQFTNNTWNAKAKAAGVNVPLEQATPEQQNEVAYKTVAQWKKDHPDWNVGNYASAWNAGEGKPNAYVEGNKGVNDKGVSYDTADYAKKVATAYQKYKGGSGNTGGYNPTPFSNPSSSGAGMIDYSGGTNTDNTSTPDKNSLGSELVGRTNDLAGAVTDTMSGKINPISGVLQSVGAVAGGLGDVVNKGLELVPGVKQVENLLGQGVGALAQTDAGKAVFNSISDFTKEHPELSKDIGASFNIVTAIPILKGLGVVKELGMDAISQGLKNVAEKSFTAGAPDLIAGTKAGARFLESKPNVIKDMLDRRLVGDIKEGEYVTKNAVNQSWKTINKANSEVDKILSETYKNKYTIGTEDPDTILKNSINGFTDVNGHTVKGFPQSNFTPDDILENGKNLTPQNGKLWDKFANGDASLAEINTLRSDLDASVKSVYSSIAQPPIKKEMGSTLASAMRNFVKEQAPETKELFDEMSKQFDIQKALGYMDGKKVKAGNIAKFAGHAVGMGTGGTIGGMVGGAPGAFIGGMIGDQTASSVANKLAGRNIVQGILKKTGKNAVKQSLSSTAKKGAGLLSSAILQKANR